MAGKYSLITTLTLDAAGFNKGINAAKASTKAFASGVETAGNTLKSAFSPLAGMAGQAGSSMQGLWKIASGGVGAFKMMIPAITGVKAALISTGIGAIVVALGTAFAALSSYLTGTVDGADTLNKVLSYVKGTFSAILSRVKALGSGLVKLFSGDFKGAAEEMEKAFRGGLLDEIQEKANANLEIAKRENQLKKDKIAIEYEAIDLEARIAELREKAKNTELYSATQRLAMIREAEGLENQLGNKRIAYATQEFQLIKDKNALGSKTYDKMQDELDAYKRMRTEQINLNNKLKEYNSEKKEIIAQSKNELIALNKLRDAQEEAYAKKFNSQTPVITPKINLGNTKSVVIPASLQLLDTGNNTSLEFQIREQLKTADDLLKDFNQNASAAINSAISDTIGNLATTLGESLAGGKFNLGQTLMAGLITVAETLGKLAISIGIAILSIKIALDNINPYVAIAAGVALLSLAAYAKKRMNNMSKFENGGIVGGTSYRGDNILARVNSGEMILNQKQQKNMFNIINSGNGGYSNAGAGVVRVEFVNGSLEGYLNYNRRKSSSY